MTKKNSRSRPLLSTFLHISRRSSNISTGRGKSHACNWVWDSDAGFNLRTVFFFFCCCLWDSSDAFLFLWQYERRPDCRGALRRNNHCHSKFICFAITVHFGEVVRHQSSEMFAYTLITAALWPFVCLLKSLFPICMEICRRPTLTGRCEIIRMDIVSIDWTVYEARWLTTQTW